MVWVSWKQAVISGLVVSYLGHPDTGIDSTTLGFLKPPTCLMRMSRNSSPQLNHQKKTIEQWKQTWLFRVGDDGKGKRDYSKPLGFFRGSIDKFWLFLLTWLTGEPSLHWIVNFFGPFTSTHLLVSVTSILTLYSFHKWCFFDFDTWMVN